MLNQEGYSPGATKKTISIVFIDVFVMRSRKRLPMSENVILLSNEK